MSLIQEINNVINNQPISKEQRAINDKGRAACLEAGVNPVGQLILGEQRAIYGNDNKAIGTEVYLRNPIEKGFEYYNPTILRGLKGNVNTNCIILNDDIRVHTDTNFGPKIVDPTIHINEMSPVQFSASVEVSKQLIAQTDESINQYIITALTNDLVRTVLKTALYELFNGEEPDVVDGTNIIDFITNGNTPIYLNANDYTQLAKIYPSVVSTNSFLGREIRPNSLRLGYSVTGDFRDMLLGFYGEPQVTVDPYSKAKDGKVVITLTAYIGYTDCAYTNYDGLMAFKINR